MTLPSRGSAAMASSSEERGGEGVTAPWENQQHGSTVLEGKKRHPSSQGSRVIWSCSVGDV